MLPPSTNKPLDTADQTESHSQGANQTGEAPNPPSPSLPVTRDHVPEQPPDSPEDPTAALLADLLAAFGDRYQLESSLGKGGFGTVFRALDCRLSRRVAMKVSRTRSSDPDKLLREARSLAQLRHPGIVTVFDVAVAGKHCFVVSELLPGPSLSEWLAGHRLSGPEAAQVAAAVADALAHAHSRSIVHRDVKPSNIVFADDGRPVLVDFGLALSDLDAGGERGVIAGTPAYMSPEQAGGRGHRPDGRTDVYGLAATLYTMLCGRHPFRGRNTEEVMRQVQEDEPQPIRQLRPDVPHELERVCQKGMAKLPGDRFTTAADFAEALRRAVGLLPPLTPPSPASPPAPPAAAPAPRPVPPAAAPPASRSPRTERRQVTLLHCTCETADAEDDPMERVAAFQAACAEVASAHGGLLLQTTGTAFLACFGYPVAHEDATRQAVRAALAVCQRAGGGSVLAAVCTGPAVVTETPGSPPVVVGDVTAAASALVTQATHAGVTVTDTAFRLVEGFFDCEPAGEVRPRGATATVPVYRVLAERAARNRMEAVDPARLTPLIGRDREVALLGERWELAAEGVRGVILLVADPGLGKSRLVRVMRDRVLGTGRDANPSLSDSQRGGAASVVEWYCSPYHQGSPFYPVTDYFERAYQLNREPDPAVRLDRLITRLRADGVHDPEDQALFAAMLSIPGGSRLPAVSSTPERQKEKTQDALLAWLAARTEHSPVLFVVEDLHWVDPSTESLLARFVELGGETRVLGLLTFRPEYEPPWKGKAVQTQVALNRLTRGQIAEMMRAQTGDGTIPQAVIDQVAERTDGVPLFVEEFTRLLSEGGRGTGGVGAAIPATLQDLLLARLDRMASVREVVQLGAVIGRTFSYAVIRAASGLEETALQAELEKLVGAGLLFAKGTLPRSTYTFKHALIQDAAYQSMVKKQRQQSHRTLAESLERSFPDVVETQPELLAHHHTEAGNLSHGIAYWLKAGLRARERSAHIEAIRHLRRGLDLVATRPEGHDRDAEELQFRMPLSASYIAVQGYAAPEVEEHIQRARVLCERLGPPSPLFHVMMIIWALRFIQGNARQADAISREVLALSETRDDSYKAEAHWSACSSAWWAGEFERAQEFSRRGVTYHTVEASREHAKILQQNCGPLMTSYVSWSVFSLGYPEQALAWQQRATELAGQLADRFSIVVTQWQSGFLYALMRDARRSSELAETVIATSREDSYAFWLALGLGLKGMSQVLDGRHADAITVLREAVAQCDAIGSGILHTAFLGNLAEALWQTGRRPEAWEMLNQALARNDRHEQRAFEVELKCRRARFLLDESLANAAEAEAALRDAVSVARRQKGRIPELRASMLLAKLLASSGRAAEGRRLVETVYAAFTEGADAPDLVAAREFLATPS